MIARYRALFSVPGFSRLLVSSVLGRLPAGMFSLAIVLFVHARTGSFLTAGMAVGAFTLAGAIVGPALGAASSLAGDASGGNWTNSGGYEGYTDFAPSAGGGYSPAEAGTL